MNMISTGAFLNEMDASNKQPTVAEKFAAVWEKKNAKAARAGGVSLMALSLAACGGSSSTTTTSTDTSTDTTTTTPVASEFDLTPLTDIASKSQALNGSIQNDFRFTDGNDVVNGMSATIAVGDTLMDSSTTDNDVLNLTLTTASGQDKITTLNIETLNVNMAAASASFDAAAMTGVKNVNVSGVVDGALDDVAAAATIKLDGYTRALTVNDTNYSGTTANKNADSANIEVSGTTFGSTAATQSKVILTAGSSSTLETLNVASTGGTANAFLLDAGSNVTLSKVVVTGDTAATIRMTEGDISGLTVDATAATGDITLRLDGNGVSTATNALLFTGVDNILMADSTVGGDNANLNGVASGQKITFGDDFTSTTIAMAGATYSSPAASITLALDNETAATDTDVANINVQNTDELNLISNGFSTSTATSAVNSTGVLDGDFTTINISGDTSLSVTLGIDAKQTATSTAARTVTVDASANTAFVELDAQTDTQVDKVTYSLTGTAGNDTLKLNDTAGTLVGGAGNDSLYGGLGDDTISGGDGVDTIYSSSGEDTVTLGAGADKVVLVDGDVAAVKQTATITITDGTATSTANNVWAAGDKITVTLNSVAEVYSVTAADVAGVESGGSVADVDDVAIAQSLANFVSARFGADVDVTVATNVVTVTAKTAGTPFTLSVADSDATAVAAAAAGTANTVGIDTDVNITDFVTTSGGDVIHIDLSDMNASANIENLVDGAGDLADTDDVLFHAFTNGGADAATDVDDAANIVKVGYTSAINSASDMLAGMDITLNASTKGTTTGTTKDALLTMYYDADDGNMVFGYMTDVTAEDVYDETGSAFAELVTIAMTSAEYTALTAASFDIVA